MALTSEQLAEVRDEIGTLVPPSDADLDAIHDRRGGLVGVVRTVWKQRYAALLNRPASFSLPGDYSENRTANMQAIARKLTLLAGRSDDSDDLTGLDAVALTVGQLVRCDPAR